MKEKGEKIEIKKATGKRVKDISNINSRKNLKKNDLEDVIDYLKKQPVLKTYFTTEDDYMADIYAHFPAILLLDATYKLLDLRMPVYLLKCKDDDGLSEIVALFIVAIETKDLIKDSVDLFKKHNPSWESHYV